jgi:Ca2+-binding RTX toxin-like protein
MSSSANFDATFYLTNNADVVVAISQGFFTSAEQHFNLFGGKELRNPNATFDMNFYAINNPDVLAAVGSGGIANVFTHFQNFGETENRAPSTAYSGFNSETYLTANTDVAAAITAGSFTSALDHFIQFGQNESRPGAPTITNTVTGETLTLTTGVESLQGTANDDTFNAANASNNAAGQTFTTGDVINGGAGTDTLQVTVGAASTYVANGLTDVEVIKAQFSAAGTISMLGATGVTTVEANASTAAAAYTNIASTDVGLKVSTTDQNADFGFTATAVAGSSDSATLTLSGASAGTVTVAGIETINIASDLSANALTTTVMANVASAVITGSQNLNLGTAAANSIGANAETVDASALAGNFTFITDNTNAATITGGSGNDTLTSTGTNANNVTINAGAGNDTVTMTDNFTNADTVSGGDGTDTLVIDEDEARGYTTPTTLTMTGFETVEIEGALGGNLTAATLQAGINEVILDDGMNTGFTLTLEAGSKTVELEGTTGASVAFTVADTGSATDDSLTIENGDAADDVFDQMDFTSTGFENVTIDNTGSGAATTQEIDDLVITPDTGGTATLTVTGSNAMTFDAITADVIDFSGMTRSTGTVVNMQAAAVGVETITGSGGNDILVGDAAGTINGGGGNDTITGGANNDVIDGGAGVDNITTGAGNDTITGGAGNDTIVFANNLTQNDSIDGGDGTDTLSINTAGVTALAALTVSQVISLNSAISNVETVLVSNALNVGATTFDLARVDSIANVTLTSYTGAETVAGIAEGGTITLLAADTAGADAITLNMASTSGTNALNINLTNDASTDFDAITAASVETITITTAEATATATREIHIVDLTATSLATLTIAGTESLNLYGGSTVAATVDASGGAGVGVDGQASGTGMTFTGSAQIDAVAGSVSNDDLSGGGGADQLSGGTGADTLDGGAGADVIAGGAGNDTIDLGAGDSASDTYTSLGGSGTTNIDTIANFNAGATAGDILVLTGSTDSAADFLNAGTVSVENITSLTEAGDANDNVLLLSTGFYANAAAISTALASGGAVTFGSGINGGVADVALVYQATSGGDARVATAEIANAGGIVNVQDVAVLTGVTTLTSLVAGNFELDNFQGSAGNDTLTGTASVDTITGGNGADVLKGGDAADTIALAETYATGDFVVLGDTNAIDTITDFTSQIADDVIRIDVSEFEADLGAGSLVDASGDTAGGDTVVIQTLANNATLNTAGVADQANILKFTNTTGVNEATSLQYNVTLDAARTNAADVVVGLFYDANDAAAKVILVRDAGGADANLTNDNTAEITLATMAMSTAEYTALTASNFEFIT